jgi:hypothetical protein
MSEEGVNAELLVSTFPWFGKVRIDRDSISCEAYFPSGALNGRAQITHIDRRVPLLKVVTTGMIPAYMMVLGAPPGLALVAPMRNRDGLLAVLLRNGYEPVLHDVPVWLTFFRPVLWLRIRRRGIDRFRVVEGALRSEFSPVEDWILEAASHGECPLPDVLAMVEMLSGDAVDIVDHARRAVGRLVDGGLIEVRDNTTGVEAASIGSIDSELWQRPDASRFACVATPAGAAANEKIDTPRASTYAWK